MAAPPPAAGHAHDPPSSPWARRFPVPKTTHLVENTYHSFLAPKFPNIDDPKYYDRYPKPGVDHCPKNYAESDSVFQSEKVQRRCLWGAETWQVAALNRRLCIPSSADLMFSGHRKDAPEQPSPRGRPYFLRQPAERSDGFTFYQSHRIEVNEKRWLPFLRKDRWFDWVHFSPDETRSRPNKTWSVDDPQLWDALKVSIELTDRILKALLEDKHDGGI